MEGRSFPRCDLAAASKLGARRADRTEWECGRKIDDLRQPPEENNKEKKMSLSQAAQRATN